ncbi:MAG TPA: class I SAM-dependent methyltransferase [Gaiellaceae bacterium]|nr:class I SAM-dependent methyltransferase [Gaiellaceae bacterium]
MASDTPPTWHHGLVARWWAEFNREAPELPYLRRAIERSGQPVLDVGCGTGRLLLPLLRARVDADGCDVSADMIALCRERAAAEGLWPTLLVQAMHEVDPPRRYRTILVCGAFGLGSTRGQDEEALARFRDCLEPGGTLVLDNEAPYADARRWRQWTKDERAQLPEPWPRAGPRDRAADGSEYSLRARLLEVDPLDQRLDLEMRAELWRDDRLVSEETHRIAVRLYFRDELLLLLERAGFHDVAVHGDHRDEAATADSEFLVFAARR